MKYILVVKGRKRTLTELEEKGTLATARRALEAANFMNMLDRFMMNHPHRPKPVPLEEEHRHLVESVLSYGNLILSQVSGTKDPDFTGFSANWFSDRKLQVTIMLNTTDPDARQRNVGVFPPVMVARCRSVNESLPSHWEHGNVAICQKGAAIQFRIASWGAAGFGYSIMSDKSRIIDIDNPLYCLYGTETGRIAIKDVRLYYPSKKTIVVDSMQDLQLPSGEYIHYGQYRIRTWRMSSYQRDGKTYSSSLRPPQARGRGGERGFSIKDGIVVPGEGVKFATTHQGGDGTIKVSTISNIVEDDRHREILGEVLVYILAFDDLATARQVMEIKAAPRNY